MMHQRVAGGVSRALVLLPILLFGLVSRSATPANVDVSQRVYW